MTHASGNPTWQDFASGATPIDATALEAIETLLDTLNGGGGSVGWWSGFPIPPIGGADIRSTSPFFVNSGYKTFANIVGPMWLPGPQTIGSISIRTSVAGAAGAVCTVYYGANVASTLPDRSTATALTPTIPLDGAAGRHEVTLTPSGLVIPASGYWFWCESTDTTAQVRAGEYIGPNANWSGAGSLDAGGFPVVGSTVTNTDNGNQYAPMLMFNRTA